MKDVRPAVHLLPLRIDAIQEAPWMLLEHVANAGRLDDVDTNFRAHKRNPQSVARRVAPVSGGCGGGGGGGGGGAPGAPAGGGGGGEGGKGGGGGGGGAPPNRGQDPPCA